MDHGSNGSKSPCMFCRVVKSHLQCCPHDNNFAQMIWRDGFRTATEGGANAYANDPTYTLGYTSGHIAKLEQEKRAKTEHDCNLHPRTVIDIDETGDPLERRSLPSVTELTLAISERKPPAAIPGRIKPPGEQFEATLLAQADSVIF